MPAPTAMTATMLPKVAWRISTKSDAGSGNCVEAGQILDGSGRVAVRDSHDRDGHVLVYTSANWAAFLAGIGAVQFNRP
ncbi:DUF397 domain-containing protein [Micromonospora sp. NBC_01796]|uniref:DUF397 domain-containing protein n=1 Tax=Micromonospora sp. NBC_01796 TaxID=2975987 RepID=UPI002DD7E697|nr:DUF397 domain-containing protein [Micromonospora sp. NBC_01796]WSA88758.1 DUF397 domain-containing protein [Micromonospora sp. NBC_01796]